MPMHMIYCLNSDVRLDKAEYLFEFEGRKFRLVRGPEGETDKLCTIMQNSHDKNDEKLILESVLKLLDRLSWEWNVGIYIKSSGGWSFREATFNFENTKINTFCKRNLLGLRVTLSNLPDVKDETLDCALSWWNEGLSTNSPFLRFICFWNILELPPNGQLLQGKPQRHAIVWVNSVPSEKVFIDNNLKKLIEEKKTTVGEFLYDQCRNAIAHVTKKHALKPFRQDDRYTISLAVHAIEDYSRYYITTRLGLSKYSTPIKILKTADSSTAHSLLTQGIPTRQKMSD